MFATIIRQVRPPSLLAGRLARQSLLFALGEGTFMTGSAVFFTQIVGLSAAQVGLGLTIAGVASFITAWPAGKLVDRFGPKRCWAVSAAGQASLFTLWPFIDGFGGYVAMAATMEIVGSLGGAAYGAYTIDVLPPDERVMSRAYMYSALNVGFTLGALLGGVALAFDSNTLLRGDTVVHHPGVPGQRAGDPPAPQRPARRSDPAGAQGEAARSRAAAQRRAGWPAPSSSGCSGPTRSCSTS